MGKSGNVRGLVYRMHFYAGVFVGPFILIAAITGFLYALSPTIEQVVDHSALKVSAPVHSSEAALPLDEQIGIAQKRHPDLTFDAIQLRPDNTDTTRVLFADPSLESSSYRRVVLLNPYTGEITGDTIQYGSSSSLRTRELIDRGHKNLWLGEPGRIYSETAASWLGVLTLGGLYLWYRRVKDSSLRKTDRKSAKKGARSQFAPPRHHRNCHCRRPLLFDCHRPDMVDLCR